MGLGRLDWTRRPSAGFLSADNLVADRYMWYDAGRVGLMSRQLCVSCYMGEMLIYIYIIQEAVSSVC